MPEPYTRLVHLPELDLMTGTGITAAFPRHVHDSLVIGWLERGARVITCRDMDVHISPGEIFVLNPGQPHTCQCLGTDNHYHVISLKPAAQNMLSAVASADRFDGLAIETVRLVDASLWAVLDRLRVLIEGEHAVLERETCLLHLWSSLSRYMRHPLPVAPDASPQVIRLAQDYIHAHYAHKLTLAELARICHLSPYHLQRVFLQQIGLSPQDYILHVRIRESKARLRQGCALAATAQAVGFVDQSHFSHTFKRLVGMTPGYFARQYH